MLTFVRKYEGFQLDGGWGRTPLFVVGWADNEPKPRKHPVAQTPRIPADLSVVSKCETTAAHPGVVVTPQAVPA